MSAIRALQRSRSRSTGVPHRIQPTTSPPGEPLPPVSPGMLRVQDRLRDRPIRGLPRTRNPRTSRRCRGSAALGSPARRIPPAIILSQSKPTRITRRGRHRATPTVARVQGSRRALDLRASPASRRARRAEKTAIPRGKGSQGDRDHLPCTTTRPAPRPIDQPLMKGRAPPVGAPLTGRKADRPTGRPGDLMTASHPPVWSPRHDRTPDPEQNRPTDQPGLRVEPPPAVVPWIPVATGLPGSQDPPLIRPEVLSCGPPGPSTPRAGGMRFLPHRRAGSRDRRERS